MSTNINAINLMGTTARGVETFEMSDAPDAEFCTNLDTFFDALRGLGDGEVVYYQVLPAGTDGEYEQIDAEYGIH